MNREAIMSSVHISGASRGIGRAIAIELSGRGHRVIATARSPESLADLAVDRRLRLDVTSQESVEQAIRDAGDIDILVSNAGETVRAPPESVPLAEVERLSSSSGHYSTRTARLRLMADTAHSTGVRNALGELF
jgi:NADP-dependent 3-hydroxy acid dehydrogenase YdfG